MVIKTLYGRKYKVEKGKPIVLVNHKLNFVNVPKNKCFNSNKTWVVQESGETGKLYQAKCGKKAYLKHKRKYGITSQVVNIRLED